MHVNLICDPAKVNYFFLAQQEFFLFLHYKGMQEVCKHIFFFTPATEQIFLPSELGIRNKKKNWVPTVLFSIFYMKFNCIQHITVLSTFNVSSILLCPCLLIINTCSLFPYPQAAVKSCCARHPKKNQF